MKASHRGSIVSDVTEKRFAVRGVRQTHTLNASDSSPPQLGDGWLIFHASKELTETITATLKQANLEDDFVPSLRLPCVKREIESFPSLGCVSIPPDPRPRLVVSASDLCQLIPRTPDYAVHLLKKMPWASDPNQSSDTADESVEAYVLQLLSDVTAYQDIAPCMSNLKEAFMWIVHTTSVRVREAQSAEDLQMDRFRSPTVNELLKSPVALSCDVAYGELFRTYYILALPPLDRKDGPKEFRLLPLDESHDLVPISRVFQTTLNDHFHEIRADMSAESLQDFSFFTAQYVLKKVCETIRWIPFFLVNEDQEPGEALHNLAIDLCQNPFTAIQILRALNISVKNGFEVVMSLPERLQSSAPPSIFDMLAAVDNGCKGMTITKKIGVRMVYGWIKYVLLSCLGAFLERGKLINSRVVVDWNCGVYTQNRENRPTSNHEPLKAELITLQSKCKLTIMSLKDLKEEAQDCLELLTEDSQSLRGGIPNALDEAYSLARRGSCIDRWCTWNYDLSFVGEMVKQIVSGHTSRDAVLSIWKKALDGTGAPEDEVWYQAAGASSTFRLQMPPAIVDSLDGKGMATCSTDIDTQHLETYLVLLPHRDLSWDWKVRLKDLYRLRSGWSKIELAVWLGPCLKHRDAPSIDFIISEHLRPMSGTGGNLYENATLHLERHD